MYWLKVVLIFLRKKVCEIGKAIGIAALVIICILGMFSILIGFGIGIMKIFGLTPELLRAETWFDGGLSISFACIFGAILICVIVRLFGWIIPGWIKKNWQEAKKEVAEGR